MSDEYHVFIGTEDGMTYLKMDKGQLLKYLQEHKPEIRKLVGSDNFTEDMAVGDCLIIRGGIYYPRPIMGVIRYELD
jgi:hypothetical protein